ncbi:deoxyribodipyrimidine photo-lyase type I [Chromohalobacter marismortui]|uniref:Deoxyribodipyrimidine photo-lyase n=1 Tax=Chromohalobacter marismortui TaxID=42055 RepID=A0A4R7NG46_9GAMM|nr:MULTISPECIES: deoxyribodipyrimidine photo-lyase [Chromohalobacter]MCI0511093.1 deoxyribodipyrimidine photo-lyase [Chromohalobacter sp.]MCI0593197.1 deoxyribodipyrimidine photo-lyase [Chromohalobacter sp.]TDU19120.1 deoxyribodipyrimidine photo-lyase type I [Chromohalobacter marismortui]
MSNVQLMWFRSDLRTFDNRALHAAAEHGPVIAVFLTSLPQWQRHDHGANKIDFWLRGVAALREHLAGLNIPLLQRRIDTYDEAPDVLLALARHHGATTLHFNREYPLNEQRRDAAVERVFHAAGIAVAGHTDAVAYAPGELLTGKGEPYSVFTPFAKAWHRQMASRRIALVEEPEPQAPLAIDADPPPSGDLETMADTPLAPASWPAGQDEASDRLERFLRFRGHHYKRQRDFPALPGTSELSPYLALGMISHRQCLHAVMNNNQGHLADGDAGLTAWANELIWREFYLHIAASFPAINRHHPFQSHTQALVWRDDDTGFQAWCEGRTGYPLVDAAMRQLVHCGWMHNRLRMVTAMFLSKHLLIDWRRGEAFFMRHLIDGDFASNNGGWQWAASTGTDAAPYFRIFNPTTQAERFDPEGRFIAYWLPELAGLPVKSRFFPSEAQRRDTGYAMPIVDHKAARQRALDAFKSLSQ